MLPLVAVGCTNARLSDPMIQLEAIMEDLLIEFECPYLGRKGEGPIGTGSFALSEFPHR